MENGKTRLLNICHFLMACIGAVIIFASLSVYFGILFKIPALTSISSNINMEINTATCFLLTGSALLVMSKQNPGFISRIVFDVMSISIMLISGMTLYEYMSGIDLGVEQLITNYLSRSHGTTFAGQMTFISAISFILIAVTFICVLRKSVSIWIVQTFAFLVMLLALFSLFNYLYSYNNNYYIKYTSLEAALLFIMTTIGIVLKSPHSGIIGILRFRYHCGCITDKYFCHHWNHDSIRFHPSLFMTMICRANPSLNSECIFEPIEWQTAYIMIHHKPPPQQPPTLKETLRMIAQLGGFLARKHDGEPGSSVIWKGLQCLYSYIKARDAFAHAFGHTYV
ncbi:MAG: hypothetical protein HYX60_00525 [Legionella longbeachae]|nr:hypothetical protein [Legionella longbeachae]